MKKPVIQLRSDLRGVDLRMVAHLISGALFPNPAPGQRSDAYELALKNHSASLCQLVSRGEYRVRNFDGSLRPVDLMLVPVGFLSLPDFIRYANDVGVSVEMIDAEASADIQPPAPDATRAKRRRRKRQDELALDIAKVVEAIGTHETMPVWVELMKRAERKEGCLLRVDDGIHWLTHRGTEKVATFDDVSDRLGRMYATD